MLHRPEMHQGLIGNWANAQAAIYSKYTQFVNILTCQSASYDGCPLLSLLQLYKDAGVPTKQFIGVPVFQAEGLTVTTQEMVRGDVYA